MALSDRILQLTIQNNISQSELEKVLGFGKGTISKWKGNTAPSVDKLQKIAEHFGVTIDYLMNGGAGFTTCIDCGMQYDSSYPEDFETHAEQHKAWEMAVKKFGKLYCYSPENERIKADGRNISHNSSLPLNERCEAQIRVLRCLFSRSVEASGFNLEHVPFNVYVSMMLGNEAYKKNIENDLLRALSEKYGTSLGISTGSIYHIPSKQLGTIAAHKRINEEGLTDDQVEDVNNYIEYLKSKGRL